MLSHPKKDSSSPSTGHTILYIITTLELGGAQKVVLDSVEFLVQKGYHVVLCAGKGGYFDQYTRERFSENLYLIPWLKREINPLSDLIALIKIFMLCRRHRVAIIHTHSSKAGILGRWAAYFAGVPTIIHTIHGWGFHGYQPFLVKAFYIGLERMTAVITARLIGVSDSVINEGLSNKIGKPSQYQKIYCGIDRAKLSRKRIDRNMKKRELDVADCWPVIGTISCLKPQKAPLIFLALAERLGSIWPHSRFLIVGDGVLRKNLEAAIAQKGLHDRVILLGWRTDAYEILQCLDLFVLTSKWEGLPLAVLEAMAARVPVVATDVAGTREALGNSSAFSFTAQPTDLDTMVFHCTRLLENPSLMDRVRQQNEKRAATCFDRNALREELLGIYPAGLRNK